VVSVPGQEAKRVLSEQGSKYFASVAKGAIVQMNIPNLLRNPFTDARVHRALRLMVDHQEAVSAWIDVFYGAGNSLTLPHILESWDLPQEEYAKTLEWKQPKADAAGEAVALLNAAGFNRDNPLTFEQMGTGEQRDRITAGELLQDQWRRWSQGIVRSEFKTYDQPTGISKQARGDFELSGLTGRSSHFDPAQTFIQYYHSKGSQNFGKYSDPMLDNLIEKQGTIFDVAQRQMAVKEVIRYIIERAPYTSFGAQSRLNAHAAKVKDFAAESGRPHMWQFEHVWLDT
jgi:ABC-type transport system substrate-binding protein